MDLYQTIQQIVQNIVRNSDLSDLVIGTVTSVSPLQVTEKSVSDPIPAQALLLTEPVVEKKIPVVEHDHIIHDTYSGGGESVNALGNIVCYEHGKALPVRDGYIILNRGLAVGDRVLMLKVSSGQRYLVLSRIFEEG